MWLQEPSKLQVTSSTQWVKPSRWRGREADVHPQNLMECVDDDDDDNNNNNDNNTQRGLGVPVLAPKSLCRRNIFLPRWCETATGSERRRRWWVLAFYRAGRTRTSRGCWVTKEKKILTPDNMEPCVKSTPLKSRLPQIKDVKTSAVTMSVSDKNFWTSSAAAGGGDRRRLNWFCLWFPTVHFFKATWLLNKNKTN